MPELPVNSILLGPCLDLLKTLPDDSVDVVITDPPYGLGTKEPTVKDIVAYLSGGGLDPGGDFMGRDWEIPSVEVWKECFRVLKPGAYLFSFAGTRTWDLISLGIRAAGFDNRDTLASEFGVSVLQWLHGQGFPKSLNVSKAIDKLAGAEREVVGLNHHAHKRTGHGKDGVMHTRGPGLGGVASAQITAPATDEAKKWEGYGTALKPAWEPILVFRKPLSGTVAENVLEHGTGALNIDGARVEAASRPLRVLDAKQTNNNTYEGRMDGGSLAGGSKAVGETSLGRWPANVILTHSEGCKVIGQKKVDAPVINKFDDGMKPFGDGAGHSYTSEQTGDENGQEAVDVYECVEGCPVRLLDGQSGESVSENRPRNPAVGKFAGTAYASDDYSVNMPSIRKGHNDSGGASRFFPQFEAPFFYTGKASKKEKNTGVMDKFVVGFFVLRGDLTDEEVDLLTAAWTDDLPSYDNPVLEEHIPAELMDDSEEDRRKLFVPSKPDSNTHPTVKPVSLMR